MKKILLIVILSVLTNCSYPAYLLSQAKNDIARSRSLDSIEVKKDLSQNDTQSPHKNNKILFGSITITGGILIGICEIISIEHPSNGLGYTIAITLPITLISAGIGICQ
jgi:hypothetical protein